MPFQQREQNGLVWFTADVLNQIPHGFSTRIGGVSPAPWDSLNLRPNQGDGPEALRENYRRFFAVLGLTVPEGSIFVMGDNRNGSSDSRDYRLGTVDTRYVIGKAAFLLFPGLDYDTEKRNFSRIGVIW